MIKILFIIAVCLITESCSLKNILTDIPDKKDDKSLNVKEIILNNKCTLIRDNWGVPHIYGKSDADAAFGLAYAQAEDDFFTVQETVLKSRGKYSSVYGAGKNRINGVFDYMVGLLKIWDIVEKEYLKLDKATIQLCEGYAQGLNKFIEDQNDDFIQHIYPVSGKDIVAGTIHKTPFFFQLPFFLADLYEKKPEEIPSYYSLEESLEFIKRAEGSNVYAVSPNASNNKSTFLAINSHQPWDGELAWYEAHIHSEEGLNMVGGLFPGSPVVFVGHNENLGWGHTVNKPDILDIYELEINPDNENQYKFDDEWKEFEIFEVIIDVKFGNSIIEYPQLAYWSIHGPVIKGNNATYAIRYSKHDDIRIIEQWYKMNKASNLKEWTEAMNIMAMPMFNAGYADKEGNILYIYNASIPKRDKNYDWQKVIPGNTSKTLWTEYIEYNNLPQVINPKSGFIQNCNSTPYQTTIDENPAVILPKSAGIEEFMTNRALRALETFGIDKSISYDEFKKYKFDLIYSEKSYMKKLVNRSIQLLKDKKNFKKLTKKNVDLAFNTLSNWDLSTDKNNINAALPIIAFGKLVDVEPNQISDEKIIDNITSSMKFLIKNHKTTNIEWSKINRLIRGETNLGLSGGPDIARAVYSVEDEKGLLKGVAGDCYILLVQWDSNGNSTSESIHQYGSATKNKSSKHFDNQSELFSEQKFKPISINLDDILDNFESYKVLK